MVLGTRGGLSSRLCRNSVCSPRSCFGADSEDVALCGSVVPECALTWCLPGASRLGVGWKPEEGGELPQPGALLRRKSLVALGRPCE